MTEYVDEADNYAADPVSDDEKLAIAKHMLMSSPPGQFWDVLADVRKLLPEGLLDDARAAEVAKAYNAQEGVIVEVGDHCCVLAPEGSVGVAGLKDSWGGEFIVDHVTAQMTSEGAGSGDRNGDVTADPALEEQRQALQDELEAYRASFFSGAEKSAACVFAAGENTLVAYVSAHKHNLRNWWSGLWNGRYTVRVGEEGSADVCGKTSVRGHYFENGNIQLQTSKDLSPKDLTFTDPQSLAKAVTKFIRESESALHEGLEDMYEKMGHVTLRNMRRAKPITADRFTWNVAKIRMRNTLKQNASGK